MIATIVPCVTAAVLYYSPPVTPLTPERTQELLRILEIPTRLGKDGRAGPPEGAPPTRGFSAAAGTDDLWTAGPEVVPPLLAMYEDQTQPTQPRAHAIFTLTMRLAGVFREPDLRIIRAVRAAIKDRDPGVREMVLFAVAVKGKHRNRGCINPPHPFKTALAPVTLEAIFPDVVAAVADPDAEVAAAASQALYYIGETGKGVPELLQALKRNHTDITIHAIRALTQIGKSHPDVLPALLTQLNRHQDVASLRIAVWSVGEFGPQAKTAVPRLIQLLKDPRGREDGSDLLGLIATALGQMGPEAFDAIPALMESYKSGLQQNNRVATINAVGKIDPVSGQVILEMYKRDLAEARRNFPLPEASAKVPSVTVESPAKAPNKPN